MLHYGHKKRSSSGERGAGALFWLGTIAITFIVVAILLWIFGARQESPDLTSASETMSTETIVEVHSGVFRDTETRAGLIGQTVDLTDLQVTRDVSDHGFYAVPAAAHGHVPVFVFLNPAKTTEGGQNIEPGQTVSVKGELRSLQSHDIDEPSLSAEERAVLEHVGAFIWASDVQVTAPAE